MKSVLTSLAILFAFSQSYAASCEETLRSLNLKKDSSSLGAVGALNIKDLKTGEIVRVFASQTHFSRNEHASQYTLSFGAVVSKENKGLLFKELDQYTNFQLIEAKYDEIENEFPGYNTNGCILGFTNRKLDFDSMLIEKQVSSSQDKKIVTKGSAGPVLKNQLEITYHGPQM